jgi:hypothetical protein
MAFIASVKVGDMKREARFSWKVGLLKKKPVLDSLGLSSGRGGDLNAGAAGAATTRVLCLRLAA